MSLPRENTFGYRDGKSGKLKPTGVSIEYNKGWNKGFKKFIILNKENFLTNSENSLEDLEIMLKVSGLETNHVVGIIKNIKEQQCKL